VGKKQTGWEIVDQRPVTGGEDSSAPDFLPVPVQDINRPVTDDSPLSFDDFANDPLTSILRLGNKTISQPIYRAAQHGLENSASLVHELTSPIVDESGDNPDFISNVLNKTNKTLQKGGRIAGKALGTALAPVNTIAAPVLEPLEPVFAGAGELLKGTTGEVRPEMLPETEGMSEADFLTKVLSTPGAVTTGNDNADVLTAAIAGLAVPMPGGAGTGASRAAETLKVAEMGSPFAKLASEMTVKNGGSTLNLTRGNLAGTRNFAVSLFPELTQKIEGRPITPADIQGFLDKNRQLLSDPRLSFGTWVDPNGTTWLDIVATTPVKKNAMELAQRYNQKAIYNLKTGEEIATGATGATGEMLTEVPPQARFAQVEAGPARERFQGTHYSNAKTDVLRGDMRGSSGIGQEKLRLKEGQGAAPGVYVYGPETVRPEDMIVTRPYKHKVEGDFALANLDDNDVWNTTLTEAFKKHKAEGANDTQAMLRAVNDAEHALRDAGYDGYYRGKKDITFLFDDQPVAQAQSGGIARETSIPSSVMGDEWAPIAVDGEPVDRRVANIPIDQDRRLAAAQKRTLELVPDWKETVKNGPDVIAPNQTPEAQAFLGEFDRQLNATVRAFKNATSGEEKTNLLQQIGRLQNMKNNLVAKGSLSNTAMRTAADDVFIENLVGTRKEFPQTTFEERMQNAVTRAVKDKKNYGPGAANIEEFKNRRGDFQNDVHFLNDFRRHKFDITEWDWETKTETKQQIELDVSGWEMLDEAAQNAFIEKANNDPQFQRLFLSVRAWSGHGYKQMYQASKAVIYNNQRMFSHAPEISINSPSTNRTVYWDNQQTYAGAELLLKAIRKSEVDHATLLYRGVGHYAPIAELEAIEAGDVMNIPGLSSFTRNTKTMETFVGLASHQYRFVLNHNGDGAKSFNIAPLAEHREWEHITQGEFRVDHVTIEDVPTKNSVLAHEYPRTRKKTFYITQTGVF
jgi:hypothetical protein